MGIGMGRRLGNVRRGAAVPACVVAAALLAAGWSTGAGGMAVRASLGAPSANRATLTASTSVPVAFHYGFDLSNQEPGTGTGPTASAKQVLAKFAGSYIDQSLMGFGAGANPEPRPGHYNLSGLTQRLSLIEQSGGVPVVTLIGAPSWMRPGTTTFFDPPAPQHYQTFAALCAYVAESFPQVKYFVVWNEMKGFLISGNTYNYVGYTQMYNDVYTAIKSVRPTAMVGGPYTSMSAWATPHLGVASSLTGAFGYVNQGMLTAFSYWLAHKVGADFIAIDGATQNADKGKQLEDPVTASTVYASVDAWIKAQTSLPIWWMESHIAPAGWSTAQGAASRVATVAEMASSGAAVGMQWQPQDEVGLTDEGLWTSTLVSGGGQETPLGAELLTALPVLEHGPVLAAGEPTGVLVVSDASGWVAVNTNPGAATASVEGAPVQLSADQVLVG